jgi:hypothetical protein
MNWKAKWSSMMFDHSNCSTHIIDYLIHRPRVDLICKTPPKLSQHPEPSLLQQQTPHIHAEKPMRKLLHVDFICNADIVSTD